MTLTLLTDLDDTLISTNMDQYFPKFFADLGSALNEIASPQAVQKQIQFAVKQMMQNQDPGKMLSEVFAEHFYPPLGTTEADCKALVDQYYREGYPNLRPLITPRPEAQALLAWCKQQGIEIAVATNPVFPEIATRQRIEWAGLDPEDFTYFTTYDTFHFTKPNITYYAECLGRLGWPEGSTVMIGDDPVLDIEPMQALGFPTFQVRAEKNGSAPNQGTLAEVADWLKSKASSTAPNFSVPSNLAILRSTPAVLDSWLRFLPAEDFQARPAPGEWNLTEIYWHLADLEGEVYRPQWEQLLADPAVQITAPDTSRWAEERDYSHKDPREACQKFYRNRMASLELLDALSEKGLLEQTFQHAVFSQTTLVEMISFVSQHDRLHLGQSRNLVNI